MRKNWVCLVRLLLCYIGSKWSLWHMSPSHCTMSRILVMDFCGFIKKHGDGEGGGGLLGLNYVYRSCWVQFLLLLSIIQNGPILVFWGVFCSFFFNCFKFLFLLIFTCKIMTGWGKRGKKKMRKKGKANLKYHFKLKTRQGNYAVFITPY